MKNGNRGRITIMVQTPDLKCSRRVNIKGIGGGECSQIYWNDDSVFQVEIIIIITTHNNANTIRMAIESALCQQGNFNYGILLMNDSSEDEWICALDKHIYNSKVFIAQGYAGKAWKARNLAHKIALTLFPKYKWICRMDADDEFASNHVLIDVVTAIQKQNPEALWALPGNYLRVEGKMIERVNLPNKDLRDPDVLLEQLLRLKNQDATAELPSCNLWIHRDLTLSYPEIESAEDHWLVAKTLIDYQDQGCILHDVFHTIYSLSGITTKDNRKRGIYLTARSLLYQSAYYWIHEKLPAEESPICLGWGGEGMVWLEDGIVIKKFYSNIDFTSKKEWLEQNLSGKFTPSPKWIKCDDWWEARYPFEKTDRCEHVSRAAISNYVQFLLNSNISILNIARKNFRMKNGELYFVDIGQNILPFEVRYFRDICARLYLLFVQSYSDIQLNKMTEKIRNNVEELQKIQGFEDFYRREVNLYYNSQGFLAKPFRNVTPKRVHENVTLLIKACSMEFDVLEQSIHHIIHQLCSNDVFAEIILLIDSKEDNFLRQYKTGDLSKTIKIADEVARRKSIDRYLISPGAEQKGLISSVYQRWFGSDCCETHTIKNIPVFSQLWGFEQVKTRYVLQLDSDVIIHRGDENYDVIGEMLKAIREVRVFGIGFNICQPERASIKVYDAPPGRYVPEVRFGLLDLERLKQQQPFPNSLTDGKLQLSWYRSVELYQKNHNWRSLRGGNPNIFYIHPPNSYKTNVAFLKRVVDLVEQDSIPPIQRSQWDLVGDDGDWKYPPRKENLVVLVYIENDDIHWARACIRSITGQSDSNWGLLIINASRSLRFRYWLQDYTKRYWEKITVVSPSENANIHSFMAKTISEVCVYENSMIIGLRAEETFIHPYVIQRVREKLTDKAILLIFGLFYDYNPLVGLTVENDCRTHIDSIDMFSRLNSIRGSSLEKVEFVINALIKEPVIHAINPQYSAEEILLFPEYCIYHANLESPLEGKIEHFGDLKRTTLYIPNLKRLEIDITYDCNLRCPGCCRSCAQAPEKRHMSIETIQQFLQETERRGIRWESVHILGGEPTLHPQFQEIVALLDTWFEKHSSTTDLKVISNGHGEKVNNQLQRIPRRWLYNMSFKETLNTDYFEPFNLAPIDLPGWEREDFHKGCWITQDCGIGLTPFGYFHCAIAGGIERIMGFKKGLVESPQHPWEFLELMDIYCRYCGYFLNDHFHSREEQLKEENTPNMRSKTWVSAYEKWRNKD